MSIYCEDKGCCHILVGVHCIVGEKKRKEKTEKDRRKKDGKRRIERALVWDN